MDKQYEAPFAVGIAAVMLAMAGVVVASALTGGGHDHSAHHHEQQPALAHSGEHGPAHDYLGSATEGKTVNATGQAAYTLAIDDFGFETTVLTVSKGTTVTWVNRDAARHNVYSDQDSPQQGLSSRLLAKGETYSHTFTEAGTYNYLCQPHPTLMRGIVKVVE